MNSCSFRVKQNIPSWSKQELFDKLAHVRTVSMEQVGTKVGGDYKAVHKYWTPTWDLTCDAAMTCDLRLKAVCRMAVQTLLALSFLKNVPESAGVQPRSSAMLSCMTSGWVFVIRGRACMSRGLCIRHVRTPGLPVTESTRERERLNKNDDKSTVCILTLGVWTNSW